MTGEEYDEKSKNESKGFPEGVISAQRLLSRKPEGKYLEAWAELIGGKQDLRKDMSEVSAVIFRLDTRWLAMPATVFVEIFKSCTIHTIPQRSSAVLLGLVNFRGQLTLCVNMQQVLGIEQECLTSTIPEKAFLGTMMAIQRDGELWVFPVSELFGIYRCDAASIENVPLKALRSKSPYLSCFIRWNERRVGLLDEEALFTELRKAIL